CARGLNWGIKGYSW
nr:immunoglobulin heavy chain junction region [Macaca mulatta]